MFSKPVQIILRKKAAKSGCPTTETTQLLEKQILNGQVYIGSKEY